MIVCYLPQVSMKGKRPDVTVESILAAKQQSLAAVSPRSSRDKEPLQSLSPSRGACPSSEWRARRPPTRSHMLRPCLALLVCGLAPRLAAAAGSSSTEEERTNPYKGSTDKTDECYAWAADGQCKVNADYMNSNCPYSCWEWFEHRRKKYPDAPIDKSMDCFNWAKDGECARASARARRRRARSLSPSPIKRRRSAGPPPLPSQVRQEPSLHEVHVPRGVQGQGL